MKKRNNRQPDERYVRELEKKLIESYKHLGTINRRISILLDLIKRKNASSKQVIDFIINSSAIFSKTEISALFKYNQKEKSFYLITCSKDCPIKKRGGYPLSTQEFPFLLKLINSKIRVQGKIGSKLVKKMPCTDQFRYYLFLPLAIDGHLKGTLFLGFPKKEALNTSDIDFYEAFAAQAAFVLNNLNTFK